MKIVLSFLLFALTFAAFAAQGNAGPYHVEITTDPAVLPVGKATLILKVTDQTGQPVSGATVRVLAKMPGMSMGEQEQTATATAPGAYTAPAAFSMAGTYQATVNISGPKGAGTAVIDLQTGSNNGVGGGIPWGTVVPLAVLAAVIVFVVARMRRAGQAVNTGAIFNRTVFLSLLVLGAALVIAVWVVNTQRREGSMTPMEAQGMEMNAPAPEGTLPVMLAKAELKPFSSTVTYSGQAVGFVEQDVVPRVTGAIVAMNVYVGDRVHRGQVLARLDTSQIDPMVSEKIAGVNNAEQGVSVSALEYQQALNMVTQSRAEESMAEEELAESRAMLEAAKRGRGSVESDVVSAQAEVQAMQAELNAAQADSVYQQQDLARTKTLFEKKAVSKDELQRSQAEAQKAVAMVTRASENVWRAQAGVVSAKAMLAKADAEISAARRKVRQAQENVRAKQASVKTAESGAQVAKGKVGQSESGVAEASAGLRGATTQRGYAELKAEVDGVVTQRLISPGTVVNPGQSVMRVAQVSPIRLQANVPESDLTRIQLGATVSVTRRGANEQPAIAKVTSIAPSVDPNSRTGVVEAVFANGNARFLPGQYLSMEITVGSRENAIVIPYSAVQTDTQDSTKQSFVWIAQPGVGGGYTISRQDVKLGDTSGDLVSVSSGLQVGTQVVVSPPQGLVAGVRVTAINEPTVTATGQAITVELTAKGYVPSSISIPANKPVTITFIRKSEDACGKEVLFPDLRIDKNLPIGQPVPVQIPAQPAGKTLTFTCNMNMSSGKVVVR